MLVAKDYIKEIAVGMSLWFLVQLVGSIWWASAITTRLGQIEKNMVQSSTIAQRLARVEERMSAQGDILCQIREELMELRKMRLEQWKQ